MASLRLFLGYTHKPVTACLILCLVAPLPAFAFRQDSTGSATVEAVVFRGNSGPASAVAVWLEVHDGFSVVFEHQSMTNELGQAKWTDVPVGPTHHARVIAVYDGAEYQGEPRLLQEAGAQYQLSVEVYPVSVDGPPLHIEQLHIIVMVPEPGLYQVVQVTSVRNDGTAAQAAGPVLENGRRAGFMVPLPSNARGANPLGPPVGDLDPTRVYIEGDRLLDTRPAPPGLQRAAVAYELLVQPDQEPFVLELPYPTQLVSLLVGGEAANEVEVTTHLQPNDTEEIGGVTYAQWTGELFEAKSQIEFTLSPIRPALDARGWSLLGAGLGLLIVAAYDRFGDRVQVPEKTQRRDLIRAIARLDLSFDRGDVERPRYCAERAQLLQLIRSLDEHAQSKPSSVGPDSP